MKKIGLILICIAALLSDCKDRDDFLGYSSEKVVKKYFLRGDGVWNIDEMKVWIHNQQFQTFIAEYTRKDLGTIEFKKDELFDINYTRDTVDFPYVTFYSAKNHYWTYLGGHFEWETPTHDPVALGHTVTIDKKDMLLFFPANLSLITTSKLIYGRDVEFQFKLSKR